MTSPTHDHTTSTPPTPTDTDRTRRSTAARVEDALTGLDHAFLALGRCPTGDDAGWAAYSAAMALICARRAGWWRVLLADHRRRRVLQPVHERAAEIAHRKALDDARFWRDTAADWQARADNRPTSDAAGALSNWAELGASR
jgi:hypothetical protein